MKGAGDSDTGAKPGWVTLGLGRLSHNMQMQSRGGIYESTP